MGAKSMQEDSTTLAKIKAGFPENAIGTVIFFSTYNETAADGPPGTYTLTYACQYAYNPLIQLNPVMTANPYNDAVAADPRIDAVFPSWMNGQYGGPGVSHSSCSALLLRRTHQGSRSWDTPECRGHGIISPMR